MQIVSNQQWLKAKVDEIVLSDNRNLKNQKVDEWERGLRPDNSIIGTYRNPDYASDKYNINPRARGNVDLLLTRQTASSLFVTKFGDGYLFNMKDRYNLVGKYGIDILGLNQDYFNQRQKDVYRLVLSVQIQKIINS